MATEYFQGTDLRSYFHTFSRAFTAEGQTFVDQAPIKAGHNVHADNVRGQEVPFLADTDARDAEFPSVGEGTSGLNAAGTLRFFNKVKLTQRPASNDQTYELIYEGAPLQNFVDPTDVWDDEGNSADGYKAVLTDASGTPIANTVHLWTFDPVNGRVQFRSDDTPTKGWGTAGIYLTAVAYVGKSVSQRLTEIEENAGGVANSALAIKPFTFDSTSMEKSDPSLEKYTNTPYMVIRKTVPAYVFEVSTADNKTLITEIEHTSGGDSIVYVAVEAASGDAGADPKDTTSFIATGFVKSDGSKITLLGSQAI
jgi:hypothetical protein